jgi:ATP-dependent helicase/nuclease subunit A
MPPSPLTDEQIRARDTRDVSVALSAGAGCGKTHVLTERFLSHLDPAGENNDLDPAKLRQLIAITFTDAAAREMRTRIRNASYDRLQDTKLAEREQADWLRLLREIDTARVSTIHAFCTALLRAHATAAGLDPTFGVLEQSEADVLQYQVIDDVLRARLAAQDDDTLDLAATFGLSKLKQQLALLLNQRHQASFDKWLATPDEQAAKASEMLTEWKARYDRDGFRISVREIADKAPIAELRRLLAIARPAAGNQKFTAAIATLLELLPRLQISDITPADLDAIQEAARVQGMCKKDDWRSPADFEKYKDVCAKIRDTIKNGRPLPWNDDAAREATMLGLSLLRLVHGVADAYQRRKDAQGKLDFTDQLALAHRLITDPDNAALRERLSADLRLLLVDEFQDTDPLQVGSSDDLRRGFDAGRLFFVGDFKQSIYRSRATPPEFLQPPRRCRNPAAA